MKNKNISAADKSALLVGTAFLGALAFCVSQGAGQPATDPAHVTVQVQAGASLQDDYDYYPGYETYYSRNRHEYVYQDGNAWVRQPAPRGVTVEALQAAPSVRMDFHDSPEMHHSSVVKSYPKDWVKPDKGPDDKK